MSSARALCALAIQSACSIKRAFQISSQKHRVFRIQGDVDAHEPRQSSHTLAHVLKRSIDFSRLNPRSALGSSTRP